jgi:hypothetical protein
VRAAWEARTAGELGSRAAFPESTSLAKRHRRSGGGLSACWTTENLPTVHV